MLIDWLFPSYPSFVNHGSLREIVCFLDVSIMYGRLIQFWLWVQVSVSIYVHRSMSGHMIIVYISFELLKCFNLDVVYKNYIVPSSLLVFIMMLCDLTYTNYFLWIQTMALTLMIHFSGICMGECMHQWIWKLIFNVTQDRSWQCF